MLQSKWAEHQTEQLLNNGKNFLFQFTLKLFEKGANTSLLYNLNNDKCFKVSTAVKYFGNLITGCFTLHTSNWHSFLSASWHERTCKGGNRICWYVHTFLWRKKQTMSLLHYHSGNDYLQVANVVQCVIYCIQVLFQFCTYQHYNAKKNHVRTESCWLTCVMCVGWCRSVGVDMKISLDLCEVWVWAGAESPK